MIVERRRVLLIGGPAVLALLIFLVLRTPGAPRFDTAIHHWLLQHRHGWATAVATTATTLGSSPVLYAVLAVVAAIVWWRQRHAAIDRRLRPVPALGVLVSGSLLRTGLSGLLHRMRPPRGDWISTATGWSMPSGHSSNAAVAAIVILWSCRPWLHRKAARRWSITAAVLFAATVGWSRAYLGVHWPTDVLAGWLFGACWAAVALVIVGGAGRRRQP